MQTPARRRYRILALAAFRALRVAWLHREDQDEPAATCSNRRESSRGRRTCSTPPSNRPFDPAAAFPEIGRQQWELSFSFREAPFAPPTQLPRTPGRPPLPRNGSPPSIRGWPVPCPSIVQEWPKASAWPGVAGNPP